MKKSIVFILLSGFYIPIYAQCVCCGSASGFSGGESALGDISLGKNRIMIESALDYRFFNGIKNQMIFQEHGTTTTTPITDMAIAVLAIRYGINNNASVVIRESAFIINSPLSKSSTFGDLLTAINYRVFDKAAFIIETQAGLEWPTGQFVALTNGSSITTGSGSYDPVVGISAKLPFKNSKLRISGIFKYTTKGYNETYFGNFCGHQVDYTYVLTGREESCVPDSLKQFKSKPVLALKAQLSGEWSQMQKSKNLFLVNTGAYVALAGVGITFSYRDFTIPLTFSVPLIQKFHGTQNSNQYRILLGISKIFN
jgi:hypothetical protein